MLICCVLFSSLMASKTLQFDTLFPGGVAIMPTDFGSPKIAGIMHMQCATQTRTHSAPTHFRVVC